MKFLLDTNVFLWTAFEPSRLSLLARAALGDLENELVVSAVTPLELGIAVNKRRLNLNQSVGEFYSARMAALGRTTELPISLGHALASADLAYEHRDPMDRILAAQAMVEGIPVITNDVRIARLGAVVVW